MYKLAEHKDEIITHIIKNLVWLPIVNVIPIVFSLVYNFMLQEPTMNWIIIVSLLLSLFISITSIILSLAFKGREINGRKQVPDRNAIVPLTNFRINLIETELNFEDRTKIVSTLNYKMTANEDNIEYFEKELVWTGKDYNGTNLIEKNGNYELELFDSSDSMHKYRVKFLDTISRQDVIKFKLQTDVCDSTCSMLPISSYMVKHQIDQLVIRVVVPPNCIKNVKRSIYADMFRQVKIGQPQKVNKKVIGGKDCYEITINNPTILYRYFLEWEFT